MITPWDFQQESVDYAFNHGPEHIPIHISPTGSGKSIMQAFTAKREMDRDSKTAILTPRGEIFDQTHSHLMNICGPYNVSTLRAGHEWNRSRPIHIVSWPTLTSRASKSKLWLPDVDRLLIDECHLAVAPRILEVLDHYKGKIRIDGYTATPARTSGKGLGSFFTHLKHITTVRRLIDGGYLCPLEYWAGDLPDLQGVRVVRGDYENKKLSERCVVLVGDVIDNWIRLARERHTLVFAVDIAHAEALCDRYLKVGVSAAVVHSRMDQGRRDEVMDKFRNQQYQVLVNVMIASYGFDAPSLDCVVLARPTKSIVLHLQMLGRGMRTLEGKTECIVLDHSNNVRELGAADDLFRWRLAEGSKATVNWSREKESGEQEEAQHTECENCHHLFSKSRVCPMCGWEKPIQKKDIDSTEADLVRISRQRTEPIEEGWPNREQFYRMLRHYAIEKTYGNKRGWCANKYKKKTGQWPDRDWEFYAPIKPTDRVRAWMNKEVQNYARRKSYGKRKKSG